MRSNVSVSNMLASLDEADQDTWKVDLVLEVVHHLNEVLDTGSLVFEDAIEVNKHAEDQISTVLIVIVVVSQNLEEGPDEEMDVVL